MINEKMRKWGAERSEIRELFEYGVRRKAEIGEENVFDFSLGNPIVPCPQEVNDTLVDLIRTEDATKLHGYTSAAGDPGVREKVAKFLTEAHGFEIKAENLYMTVGAAAALTCSLTALVRPGEEVILLAPYFPEYRVFAERCGAIVKEVKCNPTTFEPDVNAIKNAITENTAAIIVNSPNNPTGAVISEECITAISNLLSKAEEHYEKPIYLIADEPYRELVYDGTQVPFIPKYYNNTVVCYSYSKSLSLPGERIGYCLVNPKADNSADVYHAIAGAGRALGFVCAPALLQKMLPYCLGLTSNIDVYEENRQLLLSKLKEYGYDPVEPKGAFYLFVKSPISDAREFSRIAREHELLLVASDSFGYPGYVRISYCVKTETIKRALHAFLELAKRMGLTGSDI